MSSRRGRHLHRRKFFRNLVDAPLRNAVHIVEGPIVRNAASLYGTTIITSALGFFYWFVAARMAPATAVGTASAIQSAAQFLSLGCVVGLSTLLVSELSADQSHARSMIVSAVSTAGLISVLTAVGVGIGLATITTSIRSGLTSPVKLLVFVLISLFSTVLLVMDDACIGLLRGDLQMKRNAVFAASKLLMLPLLIILWPSKSGTELVLAWVLGLMISFMTLAASLHKITKGSIGKLDFRVLYDKRQLMLDHHWLNLSVQSARLIIPVVVATVVGTAENAAFTAALLLVTFVNIIPVHLSTVLFALAPGDEVSLRREVFKTMRICLVLALISAPFFVLTARFLLGLFGPKYQLAAPALAVLGLTTLPLAIKSQYVAIARVRGKMRQAAFRTMIGAVLEVGVAAIGAWLFGLTGVAIGFLAATVIEGSIFAPVVLKVTKAGRSKSENEPPPLGGAEASYNSDPLASGEPPSRA